MVQVNYNPSQAESTSEVQAENLGTATTAAFVSLLDIDCRNVIDGLVVIHNKTGGDLDYKILATIRDYDTVSLPTGTDDDDKGWVEQTAETVIATTAAPDQIVISNTWSRIVVQAKHTTLTTDVDVYFRGTQ
jgi:hypothetical protein